MSAEYNVILITFINNHILSLTKVYQNCWNRKNAVSRYKNNGIKVFLIFFLKTAEIALSNKTIFHRRRNRLEALKLNLNTTGRRQKFWYRSDMLNNKCLGFVNYKNCYYKNELSTNKVANVLATCLSNQVTSSRHITTWHYDVIIVNGNSHYFIKRIT